MIFCSIECRGFISSFPTAVTTAKKIPKVSQDEGYEYESRCHVDTSLNGLFGKKEEESFQYDLSVPTRVLEIPVSSIKQGGMVSMCI